MSADLRQLATTVIPRGAVTPDETFVPLHTPIAESVWTTAQPSTDNPASGLDAEQGDE